MFEDLGRTQGGIVSPEGVSKLNVLKSPLRYPGGKSRAVKFILPLIPEGTKQICSPFMGGGSVELACASLGIDVYGYDLFGPLVDFWNAVVDDVDGLADLVEQYHPLAKEDFYPLQKKHIDGISNRLESAAVFFVLNRCSFSGTTMSGGISPGHPRFNESSIERLRKVVTEHLIVENMSFEDSILNHDDDLLYCDPPYVIKNNNLYGKRGDHHKSFDHDLLSRILRKRGRWILSYGDCEEVRDMYKGFRFLRPQWAYGMSANKKSNEVLILSDDL